jgi:hypothetical protein
MKTDREVLEEIVENEDLVHKFASSTLGEVMDMGYKVVLSKGEK